MCQNSQTLGQPLLYVVTPCYNEEEVIELFYESLRDVLVSLRGIDFRIVFVDDGSCDGTLEKLNSLAARDSRVMVYALSRNFGHQIALSAGLDAAQGDLVLMMDSDLQHPPSLIPKMIELWRDGHDIVSAVRQRTSDASLFKRISSRAFYWLINQLVDTPIVAGAADFCLLSRKAHQALRRLPERHRFLRGMVSWIGFRRALIPFQAPPRPRGTSKYTLWKMLALAMDAIFSFSATPIKIATRIGAGVVILSGSYFAYIFLRYLLLGDLVPGWGSLICTLLLIGGTQLVFIGLIGEYVARVFEESKQRPLYLLKQAPNVNPDDDPDNSTPIEDILIKDILNGDILNGDILNGDILNGDILTGQISTGAWENGVCEPTMGNGLEHQP